MPSLEVKTRRVGRCHLPGSLEVSPARRETLGLRWLTTYSRSRGEKTMAERLAAEIMDAANNGWWRREEARGYPQDGRGQQGFRSLPLLICSVGGLSYGYAERSILWK